MDFGLKLRLIFAALLLTVVLVFGLLQVVTPDFPEPLPLAENSFAFAAMGDAPYSPSEELQFALTLEDIDANPLDFVVHVGDIFGYACSDSHYRMIFNFLNRLQHPVIYTPGDNEWSDCGQSYDPYNRLARLREMFISEPSVEGGALAAHELDLSSQADAGGEYADFVENRLWLHEALVFATVHLIGSRNGLRINQARTDVDVAAEVVLRTKAAADWVDRAFALAREENAKAVVISFHANPYFDDVMDESYYQDYEPFMQRLEENSKVFAKPVLVVQGNNHEYIVDQPLKDRVTGELIDNVTRLQVPGSPQVGWVRVLVNLDEPVSFEFSKRVVPFWKYW